MRPIGPNQKYIVQNIEVSTTNDVCFTITGIYREDATDEEADAAGQLAFERWCKANKQDPDHASWFWV